MLEIYNYKDLKKLLEYKRQYLTLIYFYCNDISYPEIEEIINKKNYNNNVSIIKINCDCKEILDNMYVTTSPIIRLYRDNTLTDEIYCSYNNIKDILTNLINY